MFYCNIRKYCKKANMTSTRMNVYHAMSCLLIIEIFLNYLSCFLSINRVFLLPLMLIFYIYLFYIFFYSSFLVITAFILYIYIFSIIYLTLFLILILFCCCCNLFIVQSEMDFHYSFLSFHFILLFLSLSPVFIHYEPNINPNEI